MWRKGLEELEIPNSFTGEVVTPHPNPLPRKWTRKGVNPKSEAEKVKQNSGIEQPTLNPKRSRIAE
jgi:hypothetical protein